MIDKTTKILLAAIATGLWLNAGQTVLRPAKADSAGISDTLGALHSDLSDIVGNLKLISNGDCENAKICSNP